MIRDKELVGLCQVIARDSGLEVTVGGSNSYISNDGNRLNIAAMPMTPEGRMVAIGLGFHEVGHKLYTDLTGGPGSGLLGDLTNIIEDVREERDFIKDRPGASFDLKAVTDWYQARGNYTPTDMQTAYRSIVLCTGYSAVLGFSSVLPDLAKAEEIISKEMGGGFLSLVKLILRHFPSLPSGKEGTAESKEMAIALCKLLEDEAKKKEQEQQQDQASQDDEQSKEDNNPEDQNQDEEQSGSDKENSESSNDNGDQDENSQSGDESSDSGDNPSQDDHTDQGGQDEGNEQNGSGSNSSASDTDNEEGNGNDAGDDNGDDNGSSSSASSDDSTTTPTNNSTASSNSNGGQKEDPKKQLSAREIMQILEEESDFGDRQKIALKELDLMSQSVPDDVRASIPQLPRSAKFTSENNKIDESAAISTTSRMRAKLMGMLQAIKRQPERFGTSGNKLSVKRLVSMAAGDPRIFSKKVETSSINTAIVLMLDNSASMTLLNRMVIARNSCFALHHTLKGIGGVSVLSAAFTVHEHQDPDEAPIKVLCGWGEKPFPENFSVEAEYNTPTPWALWYARAQLLQRPEPRKICLLLTDGEPCAWPDIESDTIAATKRLEKDRIEVAAIGIQHARVEDFWTNNRVVQKVDDLPLAMFGVMNDLLTRKPNS